MRTAIPVVIKWACRHCLDVLPILIRKISEHLSYTTVQIEVTENACERLN